MSTSAYDSVSSSVSTTQLSLLSSPPFDPSVVVLVAFFASSLASFLAANSAFLASFSAALISFADTSTVTSAAADPN